MFTKTLAKATVVTLIAAITLTSCSRFGKSKGQSTEFATFIKAYTSGIISDKSTIKVELTSEAPDVTPGADVKPGVLTFSPSVKGSARWLTPKVIEFIPENGALKSGQAYKANLRIDKIRKVANRKFRKFTFTFMVAIKEAVLSLDGITITSASPDMASVNGSISLTEELPLATVQKMIEYDYPQKTSEVNVTAGIDALHFHFEILDLARGENDNMLKISLKPENTGFIADSKIEASIPARGEFKVIGAERVDASEPYVDVYFSEALQELPDYTGLIMLQGVGMANLQVENNHARVYFDDGEDKNITLNIVDALAASNGKTLGNIFTKEFAPTQEKPAVEIEVKGSILPNSKELILPFKAVNLNAVDIRVIQIYEDNVLAFLQDNDLNGENSIRRSGRLIYKRCLRLDSDPSKNLHKWQDYSVDLSNLFKQEPGAIYRIRLSFKKEYSVYGQTDDFKSGRPNDRMVDISSEGITEEDDKIWDEPYPYYYDDFYDWSSYNWQERDNPNKPSYYMESSRFPAINLLASNVGILAKYSGGDHILIGVNDIITSNPVFNAELYVYSYQLKEIGYAKTGTDGMADIHLSGKPFVVVAKRSGATSYLKVTEGSENPLSRFDVGGKVLEKGLKAYIYGERGVWRPGDTLHVTMILEDKDRKLPDSHPVVMELYNPKGQFNNKMVNSEGQNGFYVFNIPTKAEDPTGVWNAYFKIGGATFHKSLRLETIKPNRLKIATTIGDGNVIQAGQKVPVSIQSNWLTGPAAAGLQAYVTMTLTKNIAAFKGFEDYVFTNPMSKFTRSEVKLVETRLDKNGKATVRVGMPAAEDAPGMLTADILTTVQEPGGNTSFTSQTATYSPYASYVGIKVPKSEGYYLETDKEYDISIADVDKDGKRISSQINYAVYKMKWSWWWESREEDFDSYVNGSNAKPLFSGTLTTSASNDAKIPFKIEYPEWGRYLVLAVDAKSGHTSGQIFYVDWPSSRGKSLKNDPEALQMITFSTDKDSYDVGETATVYIPAASKGGHALVSIENSRTVISHEWVKTSPTDDVTYKFKVTPEMAPNCYIHITLLQPHERRENDLPIRLYGVQPIFVNNEASHIEPIITMPDVLRPEQEFTMKVSEKNHKSMTYTIAVVDEGLLDLTAFKTPDPWNAMYQKEALGVKTWDLYEYVIGAFSGRFSPMFSIGGDESIRVGARKDNRFNPVVRFLGPFTIQSGTATHKIKLPMYVGSVRVMVIAGKDGAYGQAEKTVPVKSPLMVIPTLPRTLGTNENVVLPVNVFALENSVRDVTVNVKAEGPIKINGSSSASIKFSKTGDQLVRFSLTTTGTGTAKITVSASGNGQNAMDAISIDVSNPNPPTLAVSKIQIEKGETSTLTYSPFNSEDGQWASLEISSLPSLDYKGIYSYFRNYMYDCTEQLSAKGLALLAAREHLGEKDKADADALINETILKLYSRQLTNGGFTFWPGQAESNSWVSSMAGEFLIKASQDGFPVSNGVLASWARYQRKTVQEYRDGQNNSNTDLTQAFRLYTLALTTQPESGAMNRLKESQILSDRAAWMLASAYALSGKKNIAKEITKNIGKDFTEPEYDWTFGSPARDKAIAIEALALTDEVPEALDLAQEVSRSISDGYFSTQEIAFAVQAFDCLAQKANTGAVAVEITENGKSENINGTKSIYEKDLDSQSGLVKVRNNSSGTIYATLMTSMRPAGDQKVAARSNGLSLSVTYMSEAGKVMEPSQIVQGTEFTAIISVGNTSGTKDYSNLALTERVPSGWEIAGGRLDNSPSQGLWDYRDIRDDSITWHFGLDKGSSKTFKVKLQAAYEGEYVLPAVKCSALYDAKINANTASGIAKVTRE